MSTLISGPFRLLERRRPRYSHPERSQGGVCEAEVAALLRLRNLDWRLAADPGRVTGKSEGIPGQKSASRTSLVISSKLVSGPRDQALKGPRITSGYADNPP